MQFIGKFTREQPEVYRKGGGGNLFKKPDWSLKGFVSEAIAAPKFMLDPAGVFHQSKNERLGEAQKGLDVFSHGARPAEEARAAEEAAGKQKAEISKQEALIEKERKKQQAVIDERAARMAQNQLLSGKETGVAGSTSLLGVR